MDIELELNKSIDENAARYFDRAKLMRKKISGVEETIELMEKKLNSKLKKNKILEVKSFNSKPERELQKEWFTRFRWFFTQKGFLVVGAKDAITNEILIKKHVTNNDLVFHTDAPGSPFFILKLDKYYSDEELKTLKEDIEAVAQLTASYSKAWSLGLVYTKVFYVRPDQISKTAKSGEYLSKGSFMVYGKRHFVTVKLEISVGKFDNDDKNGPNILIFSQDYVSSKCKKYAVLSPGKMKKSDVIKKLIFSFFGRKNQPKKVYVNNQPFYYKELHDVLLSMLPSGSINLNFV